MSLSYESEWRSCYMRLAILKLLFKKLWCLRWIHLYLVYVFHHSNSNFKWDSSVYIPTHELKGSQFLKFTTSEKLSKVNLQDMQSTLYVSSLHPYSLKYNVNWNNYILQNDLSCMCHRKMNLITSLTDPASHHWKLEIDCLISKKVCLLVIWKERNLCSL